MAKTKTKPVGRTPTKRRACESWLLNQLSASPCSARDILAHGVGFGWGWATVRRAKANVGAKSFRKNEEWWWFDPGKFDPQKDALPQKSAEPGLNKSVVPSPVNAEPTAKISLSPSQHKHQPAATVLSAPLLPQLPNDVPQPLSAPARPTAPENSRPPSFFEESMHSPVVPASPTPEIRKPVVPVKPRPFHIWDSALAETREQVISTAGFADLYTMRLDIRFRQEQLHARGLLKEEAALNELLARVNEALEKKKKAENLE